MVPFEKQKAPANPTPMVFREKNSLKQELRSEKHVKYFYLTGYPQDPTLNAGKGEIHHVR